MLNLAGVTRVRQGFVDEVFRVRAAASRGSRLVPENMSPIIGTVVRRASGSGTGGARR